MTEARKKILDAIDANRDKAIKFLQDMVAIPSVKSRDELKKHPGYIPVEQGYEERPNIVATWKGTGGGRSLLLNGHTDVIPVGNGEGRSDIPGRRRSRKAGSTAAAPVT